MSAKSRSKGAPRTKVAQLQAAEVRREECNLTHVLAGGWVGFSYFGRDGLGSFRERRIVYKTTQQPNMRGERPPHTHADLCFAPTSHMGPSQACMGLRAELFSSCSAFICVCHLSRSSHPTHVHLNLSRASQEDANSNQEDAEQFGMGASAAWEHEGEEYETPAGRKRGRNSLSLRAAVGAAQCGLGGSSSRSSKDNHGASC